MQSGREVRVNVSIVELTEVEQARGFIVIAHEVAPQVDLAVALSERERFDSLLSDLSTQFSGLLEDDIDQAIESGLVRLVNFLRADRSSFAELTPDGCLRVTHSCAVPGIQRPPRGVADDRLPWLVRQLKEGRTVILPRTADALPPDAIAEKAMMTHDGMKSGIAIPLHISKSLVCVLTFGVFRGCREWPDELVARLRVAGEIFANAIARRQARDLLQRKQQELAHLGRVVAMSELASVIAHELDQPLTAIISNAQASRHLLARQVPDIAESNAALEDIIADAMRASEIVHRERRLLRRGQQHFEPLDLNEVVSEVELFIRADARQHGAQVKTDLAADLPKVSADRVQFQQVLLNLTRNGIHAMSGQPRDQRVLRISTAFMPDDVMLEVRDSGPVVDEAHLSRMFEPFFTTKVDGLGMGLSISRSIIQTHRGRMWATRNEGGGLTLHIAVPKGPV
jgi:signal transduction histidine kinase